MLVRGSVVVLYAGHFGKLHPENDHFEPASPLFCLRLTGWCTNQICNITYMRLRLCLPLASLAIAVVQHARDRCPHLPADWHTARCLFLTSQAPFSLSVPCRCPSLFLFFLFSALRCVGQQSGYCYCGPIHRVMVRTLQTDRTNLPRPRPEVPKFALHQSGC